MSLSSGTVQEEDFPRGGASALTPLEVRKIKHEAEEDVLFGVKVIFCYVPLVWKYNFMDLMQKWLLD